MSSGSRRSRAPAPPPGEASESRPDEAHAAEAHATRARRRDRPTAPPEVWSPLQTWLSARPGRGVTASALALLVASGRTPRLRDLQRLVRRRRLRLHRPRTEHAPCGAASYLFEIWNGHVMPGAFVWVHLLASRWPLNYVPVGLSDLALQAATGWLVFLVLRALFGPRPADPRAPGLLPLHGHHPAGVAVVGGCPQPAPGPARRRRRRSGSRSPTSAAGGCAWRWPAPAASSCRTPLLREGPPPPTIDLRAHPLLLHRRARP